MRHLLCTRDSDAIELSGAPADLRALGLEIDEFLNSSGSSRLFPMDALADPRPYFCSIIELLCIVGVGPTRISVQSSGRVQIAGSMDNLRLFGKWLGAFEDSRPDGYHVHYEGWPRNEHIAEDSIGLVIMVRR